MLPFNHIYCPTMLKHFALITLMAVSLLQAAAAQEQTLHLYSARHYATDENLYDTFTKTTGIKITRVDSDDAGILARLKAEGTGSPADVILLVDAARLSKGEADGLFLPVLSPLLNTVIPATLRAKPDAGGATAWFGFSTRARVIVYDKLKVKRDDVATYEDLAAPRNLGRLCTRSGSHPYNLSLFGSVLEHLGETGTRAWLKGLVTNMARTPKGGDTDQIKAVASGECGIALTNTYYLARLMRSTKPEDKAVMERVGVSFPNQQSWGTHVNVAGGAVARHSKNTVAAIKFLEYLASPGAQAYFADGNNEWPAVQSVKLSNAALQSMTGGAFKTDATPVSSIGSNQAKVQLLLDQVGYR